MMARYAKHSMASAVALAVGLVSLSACGGGSSGSGVEFNPPPPAPPPPPPPPAAAGTVSAAAIATSQSGTASPVAITGGPTIQLHSATTFPLLESVVKVQPGSAVADATANTDGGSLRSTSTGNIYNDDFRLTVPGAGLDVDMAAGGWYCYSVCGYAGDVYVSLNFPEPATSNLSWTTYGTWGTYAPTSRFASYVTGYKTPASAVPISGSATYNGKTQGYIFYPLTGGHYDTGIGISSLYGDASLQANFGTGNITGSLTNMTHDGGTWNNVALAGSITGGVNAFSGTAAVTSTPGGAGTLNSTGAGNFVGMFFGPGAEELGAVWNLFDGTVTATGSFGAKKIP